MSKLLWLLIGGLSVVFRPRQIEGRATHHPSEEEHRIAERAYWRSQRGIGGTAVALSGLAALAAYGAFAAADGQLCAMRDEQRPWIKVEPEMIISGLSLYNGYNGEPTMVLSALFKLTQRWQKPSLQCPVYAWALSPPKAVML